MGTNHKIVDDDEQSNTNDESKEHDSDDILTYTRSKGKDKDKDYGEQYLGYSCVVVLLIFKHLLQSGQGLQQTLLRD
jgi:hypothetical protein